MTAHRAGWCVAALALVAVQALPAAWRDALAFDRAALRDGQLWRLVSAHCVHLGWRHAALNLACLAVCAPLVARRHRAGPVLVGLAALTGGLLWAFAPGVERYVGLSGVIYALAVLGLAPLARRGWLGRGLLAALFVRVGWQLAAGAPPGEAVWLGGPVAAEGHLAGLAAGLLWLGGAAVVTSRRGGGPGQGGSLEPFEPLPGVDGRSSAARSE
ncbi:rhombosortase [Burkholderia sp. 3C]